MNNNEPFKGVRLECISGISFMRFIYAILVLLVSSTLTLQNTGATIVNMISNQEVGYVVSSTEELMVALSEISGGQTITLMPGVYGNINLNSYLQNVSYASPIILKSADAGDPAIIGRLLVNGANNIVFDSVEFNYEYLDSFGELDKPFFVRDSSNITFSNCVFVGDTIKDSSNPNFGYGVSTGLEVRNSEYINVENCDFSNFAVGLGFGNVSNVVVINNDIHEMRRDGFNLSTVNNVLIEGNHIHDFSQPPGSDEHSDMIQFWTAGAKAPSTDIIIRGNILNSGIGPLTQSIFMRNEVVDTGQAGSEMFYKNILVEDNVIYNSHSHGITIGEASSVIVRNNTLLHNMDSGNDGLVNVPSINIAAKALNVSVSNNVVPYAVNTYNNEWQILNNVVAQNEDPRNPGYYGNMFVDALAGSKATLADLMLKPGVPQVGSKLTFFDTTPDKYEGYIESSSGSGFGLLTNSYVANVYGPEGKIDLSGLPVTWNFADGNSGTGIGVTHQFGQPGKYTVTGTVTLKDGTKVPVEKTVIVQSPVALQATFEQKTSAFELQKGAVVESVDSGEAVRLNGGSVSFARDKSLLGNEEYTVIFDFKKDAGEEQIGGRAIFYNGSFVISVGANGILTQVTTSKGDAKLEAFGVGIQDTKWHQVALSFSGKDGFAKLYVDGIEVSKIGGLEGAIQMGNPTQFFAIGDPWGVGFPGLIDNVAFLRGAISAEQAAMLAEGMGQSDPSHIKSLWLDASINPVDDVLLDTDVAVDDTIPSPNEPEVTQTDPVIEPDTTAPRDGTPDTVVAPDFNKTYDGGGGSDKFNGTDQAELFLGNGGNDTIFAIGGDDVVFGSAGDDKLYGGLGNDRVFGDDGRDILGGGEGNDILDGGADKDRLFGNDGNDILIGGKGADTLYGGAGADLYVFSAKEGVDTVMDFQNGLDRFYIEDALLTYDDFIVTGSRKGVLIKSSDGDFEFKVATKIANIDASDFVFGDPLEDYAVM